jgi:acetylcholinesterase
MAITHGLWISVLLAFASASPFVTVEERDSSARHPPGYGRLSNDTQGTATVDLGYSTYVGTQLAAGVNQYLGVRYAAPPTGELRWRAPADPLHNDTTQLANAFGPLCLGSSDGIASNNSEDCLFVNIFAPSHATPHSKLPVWLYIQGGGYAENSNANYNGTQAVVASNHGIVLVNFNYRVGAFGFLASETIRADGNLNVGLLDQRKVMHWIKQYIHLFGGDGNHVVIHGASAGAGSVAYHLTAYGGRNDALFVGAIPENSFWPFHPTVAQLEWQFDRFVANVSCSAAADIMACLRSKNTTELQSSNVVTPYPNRVHNPLFYFTPANDGTFSTDLLYHLFEQGKVVKVPVLVGDDTNEGSLFAANASTSEEFLEFMNDQFPYLKNQDLRAINETYPLMPPLPMHNAWFPSASAAYGESKSTSNLQPYPAQANIGRAMPFCPLRSTSLTWVCSKLS